MLQKQEYLHKKITLAVIAIIGIYFYLFYLVFKDFQETRLEEIKQEYYSKITHSFELNLQKNLQEHYAKEISIFVDDAILEAVAKEQREILLHLVQKRFEALIKKDPFIQVGYFHLANGKTFLRLHKTDSYGDDIAKKRLLLRKIHKEHKPLSGFEQGESGFFYRTIEPLFFQGKYIGAFELGINPQKLLEYVASFNNIEGIIKLGKSHDTQTYYVTKSLGHYEEYLQNIHSDLPIQSTVFHNSKAIAIYSFDIREIEDDFIGEFVFFQDLSHHYNNYDEALSKSFYLFLFIGFGVFILLYVLIHRFTQISTLLKNRATLILNAQENIVIVTESSKKLIESNQVFLDFFGFKSVKDFNKKHRCVCDFFIIEEGYLQKEIDGQNWVDYILSNPQKSHFVKIQKDVKIYTFRLSVHEIITDTHEKEYVTTFEDISQELEIRQELEAERDLFSEGPVITIEWSPKQNWPIRYVSANVTKELGYTPFEMKQETFVYANIIHPDDKQNIFDEVSAYIQNKTRSYEQSYRLRLKNGEYKWFYDFTSLIFDEHGELLSIRGYLFDQSEMKKIEQSLEHEKKMMQTIFETFPDPTILVDPKTTKVVFFNTAAYKHLGYTKDEFKEMRISELDMLVSPELVQERIERVLSCGHDDFESKFVKKNKEIFDVDVSIRFVIIDEKEYFFSVFRDISQMKEAQRALEDAKLKAEAANKAKSNFLANMSHEIRTPMNAIIGLSELLKDTKLDTKQYDFLQKIHGSSKMLLAIINDILDFSKLEAAKLELEHKPFALEEIFAQLRVLFSTKSAQKGLELYFYKQKNLPTVVIGDLLRLEQVVTNLLSNALKFTHEGVVLFSLKLKERLDDSHVVLEFSIEDSGIGMSEMQQKKLFLPFSQADSSTTRQFGGTGLGLMISSKITEAMGSKIHVSSKVAEGSRFYFDLVLEVGSWEEPQVIVSEKNYKVLIVDDQHISRMILAEMLESFGCTYEEAHDGLEAIEKVIAADSMDAPYDFVLMDWVMPRLDGKEAAKRLSEMFNSGKFKHKIPSILILSAYCEEELNLEDVESFLSKPVTSSTLFNAMTEMKHGFMQKSFHKEKEKDFDLNGAYILLVEDNEINQEVATLMLERVGIRVLVANNGAEGVSLFMAHCEKIDLILMDLQMPVMSGYEATEAIRQQDSAIPIIALTAAAMVEDREKVLAAGMNDHLGKPIDTEELYEKLSLYLRGKKSSQGCEILSQSYLQSTLSSDALIKKLLRKFLVQLNTDFAQLVALVAANAPEAPHMIHTLKGVSGNLGLQRLAKVCTEIDADYKTKEPITQERIHQLHKAIEELKEKLESFGFDEELLLEASLGAGEFQTLLQTIEQKFATNQILSSYEQKMLLANIQEKLTPENFLRLKAALEELEFDDAHAIIKDFFALQNSQKLPLTNTGA